MCAAGPVVQLLSESFSNIFFVSLDAWVCCQSASSVNVSLCHLCQYPSQDIAASVRQSQVSQKSKLLQFFIVKSQDNPALRQCRETTDIQILLLLRLNAYIEKVHISFQINQHANIFHNTPAGYLHPYNACIEYFTLRKKVLQQHGNSIMDDVCLSPQHQSAYGAKSKHLASTRLILSKNGAAWDICKSTTDLFLLKIHPECY